MINFAHKMHDLLLPRLEDLHYYRSTRSNCNQIYNYKFKTERFRNSPIVYAISLFYSIRGKRREKSEAKHGGRGGT